MTNYVLKGRKLSATHRLKVLDDLVCLLEELETELFRDGRRENRIAGVLFETTAVALSASLNILALIMAGPFVGPCTAFIGSCSTFRGTDTKTSA